VTGGSKLSGLFPLARMKAQEGHEFYRAVAKHLKDPDVKALFLELASDELEHLHEVERLEKRAGEHLPNEDGSLLAQYIQSIVDSQVVRPVHEAGRMAGTISGLVEAIGLGIKAEERAVELYTRARHEAGSPEAAEGFRRLLEMEKRHLKLLAELRERLTTEPPAEG
jgi:rubrerythrin